jgi:hypothetical protein
MISDAGLGPWPIPEESWAFSIPILRGLQKSPVEDMMDIVAVYSVPLLMP